MSEINPIFVKRGFWVNQAQGSEMGQTITTSSRAGNVIIALLTILSTLGTSHLWHLVTFCYHQVQASGRDSDGLQRQQQVILRTLPTPTGLMASAITLWWAWRRKTHRALARSAPYALLSLMFMIGTLAASITSSYAVSTSNLEVLVSSSACGRVNSTKLDSMVLPGPVSYGQRVNDEAYAYAQKCYQNTSAVSAQCNIFSRPRVPIRQDTVPCPFSPSMCEVDAISFDSELLDVNQNLGINLPATDAVKMRKRTTCAILPIENHWEIINTTSVKDVFSRPVLPDEKSFIVSYGTYLSSAPEFGKITFDLSLAQENLTGAFSAR